MGFSSHESCLAEGKDYKMWCVFRIVILSNTGAAK